MSRFTRACRWSLLIAAGLIASLAMPPAGAAPGLGLVKEYRLPTTTDPHEATTASDGNVWVTVQGAVDPVTFNTPGSVARVTARGDITEFAVCDGCITNDLVQGPDGIIYISDNDGLLRRITTAGEVVSAISPCGEVFCDPLGGVTADSTSVWFADFFNNRVGRFDVFAAPGQDPFTYFPANGASSVAVAPDGTAWFTGNAEIGQIDPTVGVVSLTPLSDEGSGITVAPNGTVWVTEPFPDLVARLTPSGSGPHQLTEFPTPEGGTPLEIAAAADGNVWFTQNLRGNIARITQDGVVTEASKAVDFGSPKRPDPIGITIGANGDPWYTLSLTDKVANLKLR